MKIAIVSTYAPRHQTHANSGGVASYTKNLVTNLSQASGDSLFVVCDKVDGRSEAYEEHGVNVVRCFEKNLKCFFQISKALRAIKPDVIHVQQELGLYGSILNAYLLQWFLFFHTRRRVTITLHGVVSLKKITKDFIKENNANLPVWLTKLAFYLIYRPLCLWSKRVIVHEELFKHVLATEYGVSPEKITVIPHGVERLELMDKGETRRSLKIDLEKRVVLFVGYLTGYKGIDLLIEGFAQFAKQDPRAHLVVGAGEHPKLKDDPTYRLEYQRLVQKAQDLIPASQYTWSGFIEEKDIAAFYSASDVLVFPYTTHMSSSGPMAISIGYGVPFLASDVFADFVRDPFFCFERTPEALALKLGAFFQGSPMHQGMFKQMRDDLLWDSVAERHQKLYRQLYAA